ncbi:DVU3141 family protein [Mailhella massiliensis]|uniref:DVU3141 family protein n=1 Tax=Mailhella massiliensis TaxID=1903261 RepID=UPI00097CEB44|nr:DVU3141 family protein [Mailhella massiliensis]
MRIIPVFTAALCLLLGGCLANPFGSAPAPEASMPETPLSPVAQFISMNNKGAQASIDDPSFGGLVDVMVEDSFTSATGRDCRRAVVSRPPHEAEIVVLCRQGESWELMPRVWGRGLD